MLQCWILWPLLFIVYLNELPTNFSAIKSVQYCDDYTSLHNDTNYGKIEATTLHTHQQFYSWFVVNNILHNLIKYEILHLKKERLFLLVFT